MSTKEKFLKWWFFKVKNSVVRTGEKGGFKWVFRRFSLTIETLSGNFKAEFTAGEHPFAYLMNGDDEQVAGYAERLYMIAHLMTTEQEFVDDLDKALLDYDKRIMEREKPNADAEDEEIAIEEVKQVQAVVEMPKAERKKYERDVNGRFKKAVKRMENE